MDKDTNNKEMKTNKFKKNKKEHISQPYWDISFRVLFK